MTAIESRPAANPASPHATGCMYFRQAPNRSHALMSSEIMLATPETIESTSIKRIQGRVGSNQDVISSEIQAVSEGDVGEGQIQHLTFWPAGI
jgi:hypothetical protein